MTSAKTRAKASRRGENRKICWPRPRASTTSPMASARPTPAAAPERLTPSASPSTSPRSCVSVAPSARLMPKSRIRSNTAAVTVLESERPPITRPSAPTPKSKAEKNAVDSRRTRLRSPGIVTLTPWTVSWMRWASASGSTPSCQPTAAPELRSARVRPPAPNTWTRRGSRRSHRSRASSMVTKANRSGAVKVLSSTPTTVNGRPSSVSAPPTPSLREREELRRRRPERQHELRLDGGDAGHVGDLGDPRGAEQTARGEAGAHAHALARHRDLTEHETIAALDEAVDALGHRAQRDEPGDAHRDAEHREEIASGQKTPEIHLEPRFAGREERKRTSGVTTPSVTRRRGRAGVAATG